MKLRYELCNYVCYPLDSFSSRALDQTALQAWNQAFVRVHVSFSTSLWQEMLRVLNRIVLYAYACDKAQALS